jgi:hypothetical protein
MYLNSGRYTHGTTELEASKGREEMADDIRRIAMKLRRVHSNINSKLL